VLSRVPKRLRSAVELVFIVATALFFALVIQAFAVKPYRIPSGSMEPTLHIGDRVIVDRFARRVLGDDIKVGDIVVFHPPHGADLGGAQCASQTTGDETRSPCDEETSTRSSQTFIKRVVAVAGDRISVRDGHVIRNGVKASEPFAAKCDPGSGCNFPHAITVPPGHVFLMGDNRGDSDDSRFWGPVPLKWVIGKALVKYWPPGRIGVP
jgi:signal peptidase I